MSPSRAKELLDELGVSRSQLDAALRTPSQLEAFQAQTAKRYKQLVFKYHPDRNPGREAECSEVLCLLEEALRRVQGLRAKPPELVYFYVWQNLGTPADSPFTPPRYSSVFRRPHVVTVTRGVYDAAKIAGLKPGV